MVSIFLALFIVFLSPAAVSAKTENLERANAQSQMRGAQSVKPSATPSVSTVSGTQRACEARQSAVTKRMTQLLRLSTNMLAVFQSHADRVQNYYLTKVLPAGLVVSNYDALVADIAAKKALVQTALAKAQADVGSFSCTDGVARTYLNSFRVNMQAVKTALKNFRTSVKNLTVAVSRAAEGLEESEDENESPKPTVTPSPSPSPSI